MKGLVIIAAYLGRRTVDAAALLQIMLCLFDPGPDDVFQKRLPGLLPEKPGKADGVHAEGGEQLEFRSFGVVRSGALADRIDPLAQVSPPAPAADQAALPVLNFSHLVLTTVAIRKDRLSEFYGQT